jgi:NitT/TauT family transport system ATP-binding protein
MSQEVQFANTDLPDLIQLKDISQVYDGNKVVIKDCNLLIEDKPGKGEFIVILGPSGCGKSTLLRYIAGLQTPTTGEVHLNGKLRTSKDSVGMVFQRYSSFPWMTVQQNVELGLVYAGVSAKERSQRAKAMIEKVGLVGHEGKFAQYPALSGGQLQRVAIARSLVSNPKMLLLDEPFGALDIQTRLQMQEMIQRIWSEFEGTMIFVTHDIPEAVFLADDIYIMGRNPGNIKRHFPVNFPRERTRDLKRSPEFNKLVYELEDEMMALNK